MNAITPTSTETVMEFHQMLRANGLLQHFVTAGSGEPVVLLHGFAQTWLEWAQRHPRPRPGLHGDRA